MIAMLLAIIFAGFVLLSYAITAANDEYKLRCQAERRELELLSQLLQSRRELSEALREIQSSRAGIPTLPKPMQGVLTSRFKMRFPYYPN